MLLGPVFRAELLRTARKRHYYSLRTVYAIILLLIVWSNFQGLLERAETRGGSPLIDDFAEFALNTFLWFAGVQLATILILVPALFGGVIADEKQRKTMHYLMASRLSSGEIVLDKLAARLLHVGVFVLLGMPVMSLLTLFWRRRLGICRLPDGVCGDGFTITSPSSCRGPRGGNHLDVRPPRGTGCSDCLPDQKSAGYSCRQSLMTRADGCFLGFISGSARFSIG